MYRLMCRFISRKPVMVQILLLVGYGQRKIHEELPNNFGKRYMHGDRLQGKKRKRESKMITLFLDYYDTL